MMLTLQTMKHKMALSNFGTYSKESQHSDTLSEQKK